MYQRQTHRHADGIAAAAAANGGCHDNASVGVAGT